MPQIKSAIKKMRQSEKKAEANRNVKNKLKDKVDAYKKKPTEKGYQEVTSLLDKAAKTNVLHKNKAARLKSRLAKYIGFPKSEPKEAKSKTAKAK